jgi:glutamate synthase (NADPH/NADH) small chain
MGNLSILSNQTHLNAYCPHCQTSLNVKGKEEEYLKLIAVYNGKEFQLKLNPTLNIYDTELNPQLKNGDVLSDIFCPYCKKSLVVEDKKCESCGEKVAKITIATEKKMLPFYICTTYGCEWHGLSLGDEKKLLPKIPRQPMPEQDKELRAHNFNEVPYGLTSEAAIIEAERCIQCTNPRCVQGCPVNINIPAFIKLIKERKFDEAAKKIKEKNVLPAVCGRVCPQEDQCEEVCVVGIKDKPVAIGNLERFAADYERNMNLVKAPFIAEKLDKKIAVVGSGPAGLTCAADLIQLGYSVTIFEALHEAGGVLVYGIPEFRLPKEIVKFEIDYLKKLGCEIKTNYVIGRIKTIDDLLKEYDAVFIGVGAGLPRFMNIPGENLNYIFSANEYLTRINLMKSYKFPEYDTPLPHGKKVLVIGGGNVAMDSARSALRTGAKEVTIVYRRSKAELPARKDEVHHAEAEGIKFQLLTNPLEYIGDKNNWVTGAKCIRMELGEPDSSGRRRPVPIPGSEFIIDCDMVIVAIGTGPNPLLFATTPGMERNERGYIKVNPDTLETTKEFVYAGGDIVTGSATVIKAMGAGRKAAKAIHEKLSKK